MNQFQKGINFTDIDDFIAYLSPHERKITEALRSIIFSCIPNCKEKLAYNVPFYYRHRRICFIWPASVPWGKVKQDGVQLGFCYGNLLPDTDYLEKGSRKQVYSKTFTCIQDIDTDMLRTYLFDAVALDEELKKKK